MIRTLSATIVLLLLPLVCVQAAEPGQRPDTATKNCTAGGCHAKEIQHKVLHGPTALGACDVCHEPVDVKQHTFKLKQQGQNLCTFCHVQKNAGLIVHKPVAEGECLKCHNPHGSNNKFMLRSDDTAKLCATCHKDVTQGRQFVHGPVASGSCLACHNAHRADYPKLLVAKGRDLCLGCHEQMGQQLKLVKTIHKPVQEDCLKCHEVHASNFKMQLKQAPLDLCESCHKPIQQIISTAKFPHTAVSEQRACLNCHVPHGSDMAKLTRDDLPKACVSCHDKPLVTPDKRPVPPVTQILDKKLSQHGPIRNGNCSGCHLPHGGPISRLLAKPYPETFYEPFKVDDYALCWQCHDKELVLTARTTGLTNFRNGEENLHYVHVNKPDRGRSCRACHSTHSSDHAFHIRDAVPFGKWELPINFKPSTNGGSCTPGCHREKSYDRVTPATNPGDNAAAGTPRAEATKP